MAFKQRRCTNLCLFYTARKSFPPFQQYGGEMPATLEDSSATDKVTTVRTYVHLMHSWLCYVIYYATAIDSTCDLGHSLLICYKQFRWAPILSELSNPETETV